MPEGLDILQGANIGMNGLTQSTPRRRRSSNPDHYKYDINLPDVASKVTGGAAA